MTDKPATPREGPDAALVRALASHGYPPRPTLTAEGATAFTRFVFPETKRALDASFARPYHAGRRATDGNTNGVPRPFSPKGLDPGRATLGAGRPGASLLNAAPGHARLPNAPRGGASATPVPAAPQR